MGSLREVKESPLYQGSDEQLGYKFNFAAQGTPSAPTVTLYDLTDNGDVSATKLSGSASVAGDVVTTPKVEGLVAGHQYKLTCRATVDGNLISYFLVLLGE